nr:interleukin-8-like [Pogona vitticeps]
MGAKHLVFFWALCLACHITVANIFEPVHLGCKCLRVTSQFIRLAKYERVEIFPAGLACKKMEIIITLKDGAKVCVSPTARWVQNLLRMLHERNERSS